MTIDTYTAPVTGPASAIVSWAHGMSSAKQLGDALAVTQFVPAHFKGKPADCAAAIMAGAEVGLSPMQALRSTYVIGGSPAYYARTMVALVQRQGHDVWTEKDTPSEAVVCGQRVGSERVERVSYTLDRAKRAGYTRNAKYQTDPQAMLWARAASIVCRRIAQDALLGIPYSVEELEDDASAAEAPLKAVVQRTPVTVTPAPAAVAATVTEPAPVHGAHTRVVTETEDEPEPEQEQEPATTKQLRALGAAFTEFGIKDRAARLEWSSAFVGRRLASSKDLTRDEADAVIGEVNAAARVKRESDAVASDALLEPEDSHR